MPRDERYLAPGVASCPRRDGLCSGVPRQTLFGALLFALTTTVACDRDGIRWTEAAPIGAGRSGETRLAFDAAGGPVDRAPVRAAVPASPGQCVASVRVARDSTGDWYAAWWMTRPDSTADLVVAHSADGIVWGAPARVDTTDVARVGCSRPAPSIAADAGNVHVAYAMAAREGPGIFASHSMDRGMIFHTPVTIVYGDRPGLTAVAARGDLVAVAYEDPNTNPRRIGLALSRTMGHSYDFRVVVSPGNGEARAPDVAVGRGKVAVSWARTGPGTAEARAVRVGEFR